MRELKKLFYVVDKLSKKEIGEYLDDVANLLNNKNDNNIFIAEIYDTRSKKTFIVYSNKAKEFFNLQENYEVKNG